MAIAIMNSLSKQFETNLPLLTLLMIRTGVFFEACKMQGAEGRAKKGK